MQFLLAQLFFTFDNYFTCSRRDMRHTYTHTMKKEILKIRIAERKWNSFFTQSFRQTFLTSFDQAWTFIFAQFRFLLLIRLRNRRFYFYLFVLPSRSLRLMKSNSFLVFFVGAKFKLQTMFCSLKIKFTQWSWCEWQFEKLLRECWAQRWNFFLHWYLMQTMA